MAYAYAMGHSCTNGNHPEYTKIRRRAAELTAIIREHDPQ